VADYVFSNTDIRVYTPNTPPEPIKNLEGPEQDLGDLAPSLKPPLPFRLVTSN